jgi:hypothetical protein
MVLKKTTQMGKIVADFLRNYSENVRVFLERGNFEEFARHLYVAEKGHYKGAKKSFNQMMNAIYANFLEEISIEQGRKFFQDETKRKGLLKKLDDLALRVHRAYRTDEDYQTVVSSSEAILSR